MIKKSIILAGATLLYSLFRKGKQEKETAPPKEYSLEDVCTRLDHILAILNPELEPTESLRDAQSRTLDEALDKFYASSKTTKGKANITWDHETDLGNIQLINLDDTIKDPEE